MGMDVYTIKYRCADGSEIQRPIISDDARGAARAAKAVAKKQGWVPLYDTLAVDGTPLSATARNPGHTSLQKSLRKFTCSFRAADRHLFKETFEAFDLGNAKTVARAVAKERGASAMLEHLTPAKAVKAAVLNSADRATFLSIPHSGVQIYSTAQRRKRPSLPDDEEGWLGPMFNLT